MIRALIVLILCVLVSSCTQRMVCPAYQSAFIYDKDELRKKFSYFADDSTPKVYTASKNKYLIAEPVSYGTKIRTMQTIAMREVPVVVPDSLSGKESAEDSVIISDLDRAARSIIENETIPQIPQDSVTEPAVVDSIYVITKDKEVRVLKYNAPDSLDYDETTGTYVRQKPEYYVKNVRYNMEQDNYMWYMRRDIVLPDVMLAKNQQSEEGGKGRKQREKKGLKGFFKNLFKKKPKETPDSLQTSPSKPDEFDFIDADTVAQSTEGPVLPENQKKRLLGRGKNGKEANKRPATEKQKSPAKKDEDDGF